MHQRMQGHIPSTSSGEGNVGDGRGDEGVFLHCVCFHTYNMCSNVPTIVSLPGYLCESKVKVSPLVIIALTVIITSAPAT